MTDIELRREQQIHAISRYLKLPERYQLNFLPRPYILEVTGPPSSGKSTIITKLDGLFKEHGLRIWCPQEGAQQIRHIGRKILRDTPEYNIRTGLYAYQIMQDESFGHKYDVVIMDRGIFDGYTWMEYWFEKDLLTLQEKEAHQNFFVSRFSAQYLDAAFFVVCDPKIAMSRENRVSLSNKPGQYTNPQTIQKLIDRFRLVYDRLSPRYPFLHWLDTSHIDEQAMVEQIADTVLDIMEHKASSTLSSNP